MSAATAAPDAELERLRARLERREARAAVRSQVRTARIQRRAALAGERARTRHAVAQSGEARALRAERTLPIALAVLLPVLAAFGGWSAAGVQAGMVALLGLEPQSAAADAAWLVEPALLGIVAGVIVLRARLKAAGGDLPDEARYVEFGALLTSILLNVAGHWGGGAAALAGHALGPVGAAATAYLISLVQRGVSEARPWVLADGTPAPTLTDEQPESAASESASAPAAESAPAPPREHPEYPERSRRPAPVREQERAPEAPRERPAESPRALSDEELAARLAALVAAGELPPDAPVRRVQAALSVGFDRAKRVREHPRAATQLALVSGGAS